MEERFKMSKKLLNKRQLVFKRRMIALGLFLLSCPLVLLTTYLFYLSKMLEFKIQVVYSISAWYTLAITLIDLILGLVFIIMSDNDIIRNQYRNNLIDLADLPKVD
jgi:hypothetical protein